MLGQQRPFSPSVPAEAGCLFAVAACVHVFISADLQLQQQDPVLGPMLAAWPAKPSNMKECSMQVLVQQYPRWFQNRKNVILHCGQADQRCGTLEQLVLPSSLRPIAALPSSLRPNVQERSGTTSAAARDALWCHALRKRKGI